MDIEGNLLDAIPGDFTSDETVQAHVEVQVQVQDG
jgi:hypothetical protein